MKDITEIEFNQMLYFASAALTGILASEAGNTESSYKFYSPGEAAGRAFDMAEAMMLEADKARAAYFGSDTKDEV